MADANFSTLDREQAHKLNPFVGSAFTDDGLDAIRQGLSILQQINYTDDALGKSESMGTYLLCGAMRSALEFESAQLSAERRKKKEPQAA